jgi:hypothetical protein
MIYVDSKVGNPYILPFHPIAAQFATCSLRITYINWVAVGIASAVTFFGRRRKISNFSRTLLRHFRSTISDASGAHSEVTCFLAGAEVLLTLFGAVTNSITRFALLCSSAFDCSFVCQRPRPCYRRAVFIGDDLAAQTSPCSSPSHREGAILGPVRRRL